MISGNPLLEGQVEEVTGKGAHVVQEAVNQVMAHTQGPIGGGR
jgi:hypothetical protein